MIRGRILIVEDEKLVAEDIQAILQTRDFEICDIVPTGEEAIIKAKELKPDLVLMDITLRGEMSGIEAAQEIKDTLFIPVIYLTAHAEPATLARAKITEPYGYIIKPFKEIELTTVIDITLFRHAQEKARLASHNENTNESRIKEGEEIKRLAPDPLVPSGWDYITTLRFLKKIDLFSQIHPATLEALASVSYCIHHEAEDLLARKGSDNNAGFIVATGRVSIIEVSHNNKELIVELLPALDPFGLLLGVERGRTQFTMKAQVDSRLLWISRPIVSYLFNCYPELSKQLFLRVMEHIRTTHDIARSLAHDLVEVRMASALVSIVSQFCATKQQPDSYEIKMTRQELAELTGATPETVSRVVKRMERQGLLDLSKAGKVQIKDLKGLEAIAEQERALGEISNEDRMEQGV